MKKLIYIISLVGIASLFNACSAGYVSVEPTYQGVYRPARPGESYIWIEGNWYWNNRTRSYSHGDGYWSQPRQGRYYEQGHWTKTRRGYRWVPGGWR
jgi:hypothetical protein